MKKTAPCMRVLVVTKIFNIPVYDTDTKESARCRRILVVTELVESETQCNFISRCEVRAYLVTP